jgi:hypothetical protein
MNLREPAFPAHINSLILFSQTSKAQRKHVRTPCFLEITLYLLHSSGAEGDVVANLDCPADGTCGILFENFDVNPPSGSTQVLCSSVPSSADITCDGAASG